jgi:hypothetical protein
MTGGGGGGGGGEPNSCIININCRVLKYVLNKFLF